MKEGEKERASRGRSGGRKKGRRAEQKRFSELSLEGEQHSLNLTQRSRDAIKGTPAKERRTSLGIILNL